MSRQPYSNFASAHDDSEFNLGIGSLGRYPILEGIIAKCLMAWPGIEAEMALFLGALIGTNTDNRAALAVYQVIRRSSAQREAIEEAAKVALTATDQELVSAVLAAHKAVEAERNALAHGHFGISGAVQDDALIWAATSDYISLRLHIGAGKPVTPKDKETLLIPKIWVYRESDLTEIYDAINDLAEIWHRLIQYVSATVPQVRETLYRRICDRPRIARELAILRQKNNRATPPQSPPQEQSGKA